MLGERREAREVSIGDVTIGGDHEIAVQSMTSTTTENVEATVEEIQRLEEKDCEIIRVAVPNRNAVYVLDEIKENMSVPLIADIHFNHKTALLALDQPIDKVRINPGNIGGKDEVAQVVEKARDKGVPMRIGVNSGSVEDELLEKYGYPKAEALVESAMKHIQFCEELDYHDLIISVKSTDLEQCVRANRMIAKEMDYPLHIGITEAGSKPYGSIKSAAGLGMLLMEGIGDTLRVSLAEPPEEEVDVCYQILKATGRRVREPEVVACPTCGRINIDLESLVEDVEERLEEEGIDDPLRISVLGCAVNGPGEAREADIGVAGGGGEGMIYRNGEEIRRVPEDQLVDALVEEYHKMDLSEETSE